MLHIYSGKSSTTFTDNTALSCPDGRRRTLQHQRRCMDYMLPKFGRFLIQRGACDTCNVILHQDPVAAKVCRTVG